MTYDDVYTAPVSHGTTEFIPRDRHAILVGHDDRDGYDQSNFLWRRNNKVYQLEALLSGSISPGPNGPIDFDSSAYDVWITPEVQTFQEARMDIIPYDSVTRLLTGDYQKTGIEKTLTGIAHDATDESFTFIFVTTTGREGTFALDYGQGMSYTELLDQLDQIKGKKMIVMLACHSGSIVNDLDDSSRENYIILTSSRGSQLSWNWGEDEIYNHHLLPLVRETGLVSEIQLPCTLNPNLTKHHPLFIRPFNVRL